MKKTLLFLIGLFLIVPLLLVLVVYRWTITPYGRLHPLMAVIHRILSLFTHYGFLDRNNVEQVRKNANRVKPRVPIGRVDERSIDGPDGPIPVRIYRPEVDGSLPVIVFYHGGGFSIGSLDSHENIARNIANKSSSLVIAVDYRLAPENPFPAAFDDAYAAVQWAAANSSEFGGDPGRLGVAGDSAGGNLAAAVSLKARDAGGPRISLQILLYPVTILADADYPSRRNFAGYVLTEETGKDVLDNYLPDIAERSNPYASPLLADDLGNLPPAYIMTASFDPLLDEGLAYAERLKDKGVPVTYRNYEGMLHGFLSVDDVLAFLTPLQRVFKEPDKVYAEIAEEINIHLPAS